VTLVIKELRGYQHQQKDERKRYFESIKKLLAQDKFSHIYIEEAALKHPVTQSILGRFPHAKTIEIGHYKDLFNRSNQNFQVQKSSQKLFWP
jgi:spore photoproduct lyase